MGTLLLDGVGGAYYSMGMDTMDCYNHARDLPQEWTDANDFGVSHWEAVKKSAVSNQVTSLEWRMGSSGDSMPFISLADIVAIVERG